MRWLLLVVLGVLNALSATAHADTVDGEADIVEARRLEASLEYDPALKLVESVITRGTATTPALLASRHLLAGSLAAGLDRPDDARKHFAVVLVLAPETQLPAGTSPKLTEPFEAARVIAAPLKIVAINWSSNVDLSVETDVLGLVAGVEVVLATGPLRADGKRVDIPRGARATIANALDVHGNVLWTGTVERGVDTDGGPERPAPTKPFYRRPLFWGLTTVGVVTVGALAGWRFSVAQDDWDRLHDAGMTDYTTLRAVEDRGDRWGMTANVSFGVAAITSIATALTLTGVF